MARFEPTRSQTIARIADAANAQRTIGRESTAAELFRIAAKLNDCVRSPVIITDSIESRVGISEMRCKHRLCPRCNRSRLLRIRERLEQITATFDACRMLTLTLKHSNAPLADQIRHLRDSFGRLRRRKCLAGMITGGVYSIEIVFNNATNQWHPHLHAIIDGTFIPHAVLKREWIACSDGSSIVDIRAAINRSVVLGYILKYVSKGIDASKFPTAALAEYVPAVNALRLVGTFGHAHGWATETSQRPRWTSETHYVAHYDVVMDSAIGGDDAAAQAISIIAAQHQGAREFMDSDGHVIPPEEWTEAATEAVAVCRRVMKRKFDGYEPNRITASRAQHDPVLIPI